MSASTSPYRSSAGWWARKPSGLTRRAWLLQTGAFFAACCGAGRVYAQHAAAARGCPPPSAGSAAEQEAHGVRLLLAMALVYDGWCIDRSRPEIVAAYAEAEPGRRFNDYLGHNIGALLVTAQGGIVCFTLNRNISCNSTLEHAEARAVRAGTRLANAAPHGAGLAAFRPPLRGDLLYTTLEPCAQCAGIMDLADIAAAVYLQEDPGQQNILDVLYDLTCGSATGRAPLPVAAGFLQFRSTLDGAYAQFHAAAAPGAPRGVTAFLSTVLAYRVYRDAAAAFETMAVEHLANTPVLLEARAFRATWAHRMAEGGAPDAVLPCF